MFNASFCTIYNKSSTQIFIFSCLLLPVDGDDVIMPLAIIIFPWAMHTYYIIFALGLPSTAANLAIYGEIGRTPLDIRRNVLMVKYC